MQNLCISRMESALIGNLQWNLILIQDLDTPTRLPVLCTENFFFFFKMKLSVFIGPTLAGFSHADFYCPQLSVELKKRKMPFPLKLTFSSFIAPHLFPDLQGLAFSHRMKPTVSINTPFNTFHYSI